MLISALGLKENKFKKWNRKYVQQALYKFLSVITKMNMNELALWSWFTGLFSKTSSISSTKSNWIQSKTYSERKYNILWGWDEGSEYFHEN